MEWVTTTGKTVDEAKERALDQLGVLADDAEFKVIEEPRAGLFGRVRGEAKVQARVRPTPVRAKVERKGRGRADSSGDAKPAKTETSASPATRPAGRRAAAPAAAADTSSTAELSAPAAAERAPKESGNSAKRGRGERTDRTRKEPAVTNRGEADNDRRESSDDEVDAATVGAEAEKFLLGLLDAFGLEGTVTVNRDGDDLDVRVDGDDLGVLIGPKGATLLAVQDIVRVASQRRLGDHNTHLRIDIGGYRERRREALTRFATQQADLVRESGRARILEPMPSADRKIVHDTVSGLPGVASRSEGEDPKRRVVIVPAGDAS